MTHSTLTNQIRESMQRSSRNGTQVDTFLIHHQAGTNDDATINAMVNETKDVSANYTISNEGRLTLVVNEDYRAHTSGSSTDGGKGAQMDRRSITVEIENESAGPDWRISAAALNTAAALLRDLRSRYRISNVYGHRQLWELFRASYPTYCPGPSTVANIVAIAGGGAALPAGPAAIGTTAPALAVDYAYGLTAAAQMAVQKALARLGRYTGDQDGDFGSQSVKSFQQLLKDAGLLQADYEADGIPGPLYGEALHDLADKNGYTGTHEGLPGGNVSEALERWATTIAPSIPQVVEAPAGRDWSYVAPDGSGKVARVQAALKARGRYDGPVDDEDGPRTRKGIQITLDVSGEFHGDIDGVIERGGCYGMQTYAARFGDYVQRGGVIDGAPRELTWDCFALGLERP